MPPMDLRDLQRHWDTFGRRDPFWAILTDPARRGNRWSPEEFFETGRAEIAELMSHAARLQVPRERRRALDFGCGAGRLTQALAAHFESTVGVDVAPSMIALADLHNPHGGRCMYAVNDEPHLRRWADASFDLIYTSRVLQHIEPRYSTRYLREFVRLLSPGGYLSFDLPSASGEAAALADQGLPPSAMRAHIVASPSGPLMVTPGAPLRFDVRITNRSAMAWTDADGRVLNVGNHWLDAARDMVQQDDQRVKLPTPLAAGASIDLPLTVTAPANAGTHWLEFDVVLEGVAWFATCGSQAAQVAVHVGAPASTVASGPGGTSRAPEAAHAGPQPVLPSADADIEPLMEMHAVPREEVEGILREAGARLLDVRRVHHCGPLWLAFRYDVTKE
jgi:SAM-dependent methyltransferase